MKLVLSAPVGRDATVKADQVISRKGDRPSRSSMVGQGVACTSKVVTGGRRQIMALRIAGDMPDLHSLHLRHLDSDIWAVTDCKVDYFAHADLRALNRKHPRLEEDLWRTTLVEGAIYREWMVNNSQREALSRIAHFFCEMMLRMQAAGLARDNTCPLPITQADLSEMTALSQVHVNRTLQTLRAQNLVSFGRGTLTIHDCDGLAEIGNFRADCLHLPQAEAA